MKNSLILIIVLVLSGCSLALKIKSGDMAFDLKHYNKAAELYAEEYEVSNTKDQQYYLANRAAQSYELINNFSKALEWHSLAYQHNKSDDALLKLGKSAIANDSITVAKSIFTKLYKETSDRNYLKQVGYLEKLDYNKKEFDVFITSYSSAESDYAPMRYEANYVLFSSDRMDYNETINTYTGRNTTSMFLVNTSGSNAFLFDRPVNSDFGDAAACFNKTYDEVYFTRCIDIDERDVHCRIYQSNRVLGQWREPQPIMFFTEDVNVGHPAYLDSDSILIFSANPDGNHQLYFSKKLESTWSLPELLPETISSPYNEKFPVIEEDTLYFASDRFPGYGQLDLYKTYVGSDGFWTSPKLLDPPYNSGADDFGYATLQEVQRGVLKKQVLISSNRVGGKGLDDIWNINQYELSEDIEIETPDEEEYDIYLTLSTKDNDTKEPISCGVTLTQSGTIVLTNKTDAQGRFIKEMKETGLFNIQLSKPGYFNQSLSVTLPTRDMLKKDTTVSQTIFLEPIELGKEIVLEDIYYDFDKWDIRDDAKPSLNALSSLLKENPTISIELGSHTDCRGDNDYNEDLSQKRAKSAKDYLVALGISNGRVMSKGYGESNPKDNCDCDNCNEDQHQINRRTSFRVIKL